VGARALPARALIAAIALLALGAPAAGAKGITSGKITVGRGANGVTLGDSRAQVIDTLGKPLTENSFGTMSYGRIPVIFDIYRKGSHVRQFVIAAEGAPAGHFALSDGNHIFKSGGLRRVADRYGKRLRFHRFDDGSPYYEIVSRLHGRKVLTDFETDRHGLGANVLDVFILFAS
jgi:hypothetical protein